jgi:hypothetical protein
MDELPHKLVVQLAEPAPAPSHPLIEVSEKGQLRASRRYGVPAPGEMLRERVKMRAKNSRSQAPNRVATFEELIQHVSSIPGSRAAEEKTAGLCRLGKRELTVTGAKRILPR